MKSIQTYVNETRERVGEKFPLSLDEFVEFVGLVADGKDDYTEYKRVEKLITDLAGYKVWRTLLGWLQGNAWCVDPETLYKQIQNIPLERVERLLGAGSFISTVKLDDDRVIKWFHEGQKENIEENDWKFYRYCLRRRSKYFPRVYKITDRYLIQEAVEADTKKCKDLYDLIMKADVFDDVVKKYRGRRSSSMFWIAWILTKGEETIPDTVLRSIVMCETYMDRKTHEAWEWIHGAMREGMKNGFDVSDVKPMNMGERKNGSIVLLDI